MNRSLLVLAAIALGGCAQDSALTAAAPTAPALSLGADAGAGRGIVASVTGHAENTFFNGQLLRNVSFSARKDAGGGVQGNFQVTLDGPGRITGYPDEGLQPIHFEVVCLEVSGNKAWIGGRIVAPKTDPYLGGEDVWYVEDGGDTGPDLVRVFIGRAASRCSEKPVSGGAASERGELIVRDGQ